MNWLWYHFSNSKITEKKHFGFSICTLSLVPPPWNCWLPSSFISYFCSALSSKNGKFLHQTNRKTNEQTNYVWNFCIFLFFRFSKKLEYTLNNTNKITTNANQRDRKKNKQESTWNYMKRFTCTNKFFFFF